jgi:small nuclear ribonucleoprotein (snRNP)-like protein
MDKKLFVHLQGGRKVSGTLRGYDLFLNLVIDDALEESTPAQKHPIGTVVCSWVMFTTPIESHLYRSFVVTV